MIPQAVRIPVDWLALVVEWSGPEDPPHNPPGKRRRRVVRNHARDPPDSRVFFIDVEEFLDEIGFEDNVVVQEYQNIGFGAIDRGVTRRRSATVVGFVQIEEPRFFAGNALLKGFDDCSCAVVRALIHKNDFVGRMCLETERRHQKRAEFVSAVFCGNNN